MITPRFGFAFIRTISTPAYVQRKRFPYFKLGVATGLGSFIAYDGLTNEFTSCRASIRFLRSLKTAALVSIDYMLLSRHEHDEDYEEATKLVHLKSAKRLLDTCLLNGGLYIKIGQGFAAINHILPKEYTSTLAQLEDKCLPTTREDVRRVFSKDFGQLPEDIYVDFDYEPVAAASLAQVFKAKLPSGEDVAVKVQYNDLRRRFPSDLGTIIFLHDIIELIFKNYNFGWILRDLSKNLVQEMDFVNEGQNSERCAKDLERFEFVHVPKVHWNYTKPRVLTMEWIDGFKISDTESIERQKLDLRDIDMKLFQMFSEQIFSTGFVHADPHPGNIFVRKNAKSGKADLILLDHGLYEELPSPVRLQLCEFWEATVLKDELKMEMAARKMNIHDYMKFAEVLFQQPIRIRGGMVVTKLTEQDIRHIQEVARKNFDVIMDTLKEMPRNMLFVVRNLNTVRAIGTQHGDIVDRARVMARYAQRCVYTHSHTVFGYLKWISRRFMFEYHLWKFNFKLNVMNLYLNILYHLGRAPEAAKTLVKDIQRHDDLN